MRDRASDPSGGFGAEASLDEVPLQYIERVGLEGDDSPCRIVASYNSVSARGALQTTIAVVQVGYGDANAGLSPD